MRILHVTDRLSARGGADWHLLGVMAALAERGHAQTLAVGRVDATTTTGVPHRVVGGLDGGREVPGLAARLEEVAREVAPEVVHLHNAVSPSALAWAADRGAVATVQDHRSFCPGAGKLTLAGAPCERAMSRELCRDCFTDEAYFEGIVGITERRRDALLGMRGITVLSGYMKRELGAVGVDAGRVAVIPPFVHGLDAEAEPNGPPCVLFAGRLVAAKGLTDAVEAWQRSAVVGELPLVLAGSGRLRGELEAAGHEVLGWVEHRAMSAVYRRARVLVMPSRWQEPYGIVGPEALTLGVSVAAYDSGGVAEWHPGGATLVPWGDVDALAAAIDAAARGARPAPPPCTRDARTDELEAFYRANT